MKHLEVRRENLRDLIEQHGSGNLATKLGYRQASFLSQLAGPKPTRDITEKSARNFEEKLGLPRGYLDIPHANEAPKQEQPAPSCDPMPMVVSVITLIGEICAEEEVTLPTGKFANVVVLAYKDAMEHDAAPRADHIKQIVRLLK